MIGLVTRKTFPCHRARFALDEELYWIFGRLYRTENPTALRNSTMPQASWIVPKMIASMSQLCGIHHDFPVTLYTLGICGQWLLLLWCHNEHDGVSNHQPYDCLLNRLFRRRSKETPKLRVTGLCAGNSPAVGEFPAQRDSNAENVSNWWRHHGLITMVASNRGSSGHGMGLIGLGMTNSKLGNYNHACCVFNFVRTSNKGHWNIIIHPANATGAFYRKSMKRHGTLTLRVIHNVEQCSSAVLTHWGRATHICVSKLTIIGLDNGLLPVRCQAIIGLDRICLTTTHVLQDILAVLHK